MDDIEAMHKHVTDALRQALADTQWALINANARMKIQEGLIAELQALSPAPVEPTE